MIGAYLKRYIKSNGIEQVFISEKTGICLQVLGDILNEQRKMEVAEYYDICAAIGVSPVQIAKEAGVYSVSE